MSGNVYLTFQTMGAVGTNMALTGYFGGILAYVVSSDLSVVVIALELILLSVGILLVNLSYNLDD